MKQLLLPFYFKKAGFLLAILGIVSTYVRFGLGIKPDFLDIKTFAIYSSIFKTVWLSIVNNNISEEICAILFLSGLIMIAFSKEKTELDGYDEIRTKSLFSSVYLSYLLLFLSIIFVYGIGFLTILSINMFSLLVIYILISRYYIFRHAKPEDPKIEINSL
jgi:hypothetical protein